MSSARISELTALAEAPADGDLVPIVDVSDTTDAATGTNKKNTAANLFKRKEAVKAWINFNGTGTPAIRDSFNISSITDNGTGDYWLNFTNSLSNTNYCVSGTTGNSATPSDTVLTVFWVATTTSALEVGRFRIITAQQNGSANPLALDLANVYAEVFSS